MKWFTLALLVFAAGCVSAPAETVSSSFETVAPDGVVIRGTLYVPSVDGAYPVVILAHQFGASRGQWNPYISEFTDRGYAVAAYDMRGFGESVFTLSRGSRSLYRPGPTYLEDMVLDVSALLDIIERSDRLNESRVAVVGASVGANVAYVSSHYPGVRTAVALSPSSGALSGARIEGFSPRGVLFIADSSEIGAARALFEKTAEPKKLVELEKGHGIALLPDTLPDVFKWLGENL